MNLNWTNKSISLLTDGTIRLVVDHCVQTNLKQIKKAYFKK